MMSSIKMLIEGIKKEYKKIFPNNTSFDHFDVNWIKNGTISFYNIEHNSGNVIISCKTPDGTYSVFTCKNKIWFASIDLSADDSTRLLLKFINNDEIQLPDSDGLVPLSAPVGKFVIDNAKGIDLSDGTYYHYSVVCQLLKKYKSDNQ